VSNLKQWDLQGRDLVKLRTRRESEEKVLLVLLVAGIGLVMLADALIMG